MNETIDNRVAYQPSPDALAEISVETNNYAADVGNVGGAVISNVIKSGTNQLPRQRVRVLPQQRLRREHAGRTTARARRSQERTQHIFGGTLGGPIVKNKLFFFARLPGLAAGRARAPAPRRSRRPRGAPATCRASPTPIIGPAHRAAVPEQPDPAEPDQPDRARRSSTTPRTTRCPTATCRRRHGQLRGRDPAARSAPTRATLRLDWNASANDKLFVRFSFATYTGLARQERRSRCLLGARTTSRSGTSAVNWSHVFGPSLVNEVLVGFSNTTRHRRDLRLGRHRRRPTRRTASPAASRSPASARSTGAAASRTPGAIATDSDTLAKTLPDQREAHLAQGPPHAEVRRPVAALQPAALLRRQQRPARLLHLQRRLHRLRLLRLPARPGVEQGPWRRRPERPVDAPPEPDRPLRRRTTSRSRRT